MFTKKELQDIHMGLQAQIKNFQNVAHLLNTSPWPTWKDSVPILQEKIQELRTLDNKVYSEIVRTVSDPSPEASSDEEPECKNCGMIDVPLTSGYCVGCICARCKKNAGELGQSMNDMGFCDPCNILIYGQDEEKHVAAPSSRISRLPFLFRVPTDGIQKEYFIVKIAVFDYVSYNSSWMCDPNLPPQNTLVPDVDMTEDKHQFDSEVDAIKFIREWWWNQ